MVVMVGRDGWRHFGRGGKGGRQLQPQLQPQLTPVVEPIRTGCTVFGVSNPVKKGWCCPEPLASGGQKKAVSSTGVSSFLIHWICARDVLLARWFCKVLIPILGVTLGSRGCRQALVPSVCLFFVGQCIWWLPLLSLRVPYRGTALGREMLPTASVPCRSHEAFPLIGSCPRFCFRIWRRYRGCFVSVSHGPWAGD